MARIRLLRRLGVLVGSGVTVGVVTYRIHRVISQRLSSEYRRAGPDRGDRCVERGVGVFMGVRVRRFPRLGALRRRILSTRGPLGLVGLPLLGAPLSLWALYPYSRRVSFGCLLATSYRINGNSGPFSADLFLSDQLLGKQITLLDPCSSIIAKAAFIM